MSSGESFSVGFTARLRATCTQHTTLLNTLSETFRVPTLPPLEDYVCLYGGNPFRSSDLRGTSPHGSVPSGSLSLIIDKRSLRQNLVFCYFHSLLC